MTSERLNLNLACQQFSRAPRAAIYTEIFSRNVTAKKEYKDTSHKPLVQFSKHWPSRHGIRDEASKLGGPSKDANEELKSEYVRGNCSRLIVLTDYHGVPSFWRDHSSQPVRLARRCNWNPPLQRKGKPQRHPQSHRWRVLALEMALSFQIIGVPRSKLHARNFGLGLCTRLG